MFLRFFRPSFWRELIWPHTRRDIFRYWDGQQWRYCDPLVVWRQLFEDPTVDAAIDFRLATGVDANGQPCDYDPEAQDRVLQLIRRTLDVAPWSEKSRGLTVGETFELLWKFFQYVNDMKKKRDLLLTQSPPTDSESSEDPSTMPPDSGSSSTKSESKSDEQPSFSKRSVVL